VYRRQSQDRFRISIKTAQLAFRHNYIKVSLKIQPSRQKVVKIANRY